MNIKKKDKIQVRYYKYKTSFLNIGKNFLNNFFNYNKFLLCYIFFLLLIFILSGTYSYNYNQIAINNSNQIFNNNKMLYFIGKKINKYDIGSQKLATKLSKLSITHEFNIITDQKKKKGGNWIFLYYQKKILYLINIFFNLFQKNIFFFFKQEKIFLTILHKYFNIFYNNFILCIFGGISIYLINLCLDIYSGLLLMMLNIILSCISYFLSINNYIRILIDKIKNLINMFMNTNTVIKYVGILYFIRTSNDIKIENHGSNILLLFTCLVFCIIWIIKFLFKIYNKILIFYNYQEYILKKGYKQDLFKLDFINILENIQIIFFILINKKIFLFIIYMYIYIKIYLKIVLIGNVLLGCVLSFLFYGNKQQISDLSCILVSFLLMLKILDMLYNLLSKHVKYTRSSLTFFKKKL